MALPNEDFLIADPTTTTTSSCYQCNRRRTAAAAGNSNRTGTAAAAAVVVNSASSMPYPQTSIPTPTSSPASTITSPSVASSEPDVRLLLDNSSCYSSSRHSSYRLRLPLVFLFAVVVASLFIQPAFSQKAEYFMNTPYGMCVPGLVFRVAAQAGEIITPGYPDEYPPKQDCRWLIDVTDAKRPSRVAVLKFIDFRIETLCSTERVEIYDGEDLNAPLLARICGNIDSYDDVQRWGGDGKRSWYNQTLVDVGFIGDDGWSYFASSSVMLVRFVSDNIYSYRGFRAIFFGEDMPDFIANWLYPPTTTTTSTTMSTTTTTRRSTTTKTTTTTTTAEMTTTTEELPFEVETTEPPTTQAPRTTTKKVQAVAPRALPQCFGPTDRLPPAAYNMRSTAFQFLVEPSIPCDGVIDSVEFVSTQSSIDFILLVLRRYHSYDWLRSNQTYWLLAYRNISTANFAIRPYTWTSVNIADPISVNKGDLIGFMYHSIFVNHDTAPVIPHALTNNKSYAGYAELWDWNVLTDFILHPDKAGDSPLKRPLFDLHEVSSLNRPFRMPAIRVRVSHPQGISDVRPADSDPNYPLLFDAPTDPQQLCRSMLLAEHGKNSSSSSSSSSQSPIEPCDAESNTLASRIYLDPYAGQCTTTYDCSTKGHLNRMQNFFRSEEECSSLCSSFLPLTGRQTNDQ